MAGSANNVLISPVNVSWEIEAQEQLDFTGKNTADLAGTELNLFKVDGTKVRVFFQEGGSPAAPVAGANEVVIAVDSVASVAVSVIATNAASALDADADLISSSSGAVVDVRRAAVGEVSAAADVDSTVAITQCRLGKNYDLGLIQGSVELNFAPANFIVQAHQTGVTPRAALNQGFETAEVTTTLLETISSNLQPLYDLYGGAFTPAAGTQVYGAGTSVQGSNLLTKAARLKLRPVNAADGTTDTNLMLAIPVPGTLTFSGEEPRILSVTWQGFKDDAIDTRVDTLLFGDAFQAGLFV